jgi:ribosomal protein S18 acetylase RimI-like enzyme
MIAATNMRPRPAVVADAPGALDVLLARDIADVGVPDYVLEDLLDEWQATDLDLATDSRIVELGGRIVAYALVHGPISVAVVTPRCEGGGIGAGLLSWVEGRERELGRSEHRQWIGSGNERGRVLLQSAGYERVRSYWRMGLKLDDVGNLPSRGPRRLRLRSLNIEQDAGTLHALDDASFADAPDYHPESLQGYREAHLDAHDLDPELSRVAELNGQIVGSLLARRWTDAPVAFIDILAVHPDHQGVGIGAALLIDAFRRFRAAGLEEAQLGVASSNPRALGLYERLGMIPRFRYDTYERPVLGGEDGANAS